MLVSVVVPIYGTERYVEKCLRSLMQQTYRDIEIIAVDDASPDGAAAIAERLATEDTRIRLLRLAVNQGLGGARNEGIAAAAGEYVAFVDSDDYVDEEFIARLAEASDSGRYDVVACGFERVDEAGDHIAETRPRPVGYETLPATFDPFAATNPAVWNKLWRRSLIASVPFPLHAFYEDQATTPRWLARATSMKVIDGTFYKYLVRAGSIVNGTSDKHVLDHLRAFDLVKSDLMSLGVYARYAPKFRARIGEAARSYAAGVLAGNPADETAATNVRHLIVAMLGYEHFDDLLREGERENWAAMAKSGANGLYPPQTMAVAVPPESDGDRRSFEKGIQLGVTLRAVRKGRAARDALVAWESLNQTWRSYRRGSSREAALVLIGAQDVMADRIEVGAAGEQDAFQRASAIDAAQMKRRLDAAWPSRLSRLRGLAAAVGPIGLLRLARARSARRGR